MAIDGEEIYFIKDGQHQEFSFVTVKVINRTMKSEIIRAIRSHGIG